ncbi:P-loop containing nucleoside triphosphate hydrolase protein [Dunaliella salina]|uniref:GTPase Der n=1 Tax=Dunaliella salina TaxID=3046 RepID=A0ABQ7G239_DUNSA|nr:P-loop containing nucleoside triphosphate hydrolase protein [Dunaliella salina]|eukprot:KAF5828667.1 P-loop containing nucleoside triphosphate hydrolase protein [Dunaliella salina]
MLQGCTGGLSKRLATNSSGTASKAGAPLLCTVQCVKTPLTSSELSGPCPNSLWRPYPSTDRTAHQHVSRHVCCSSQGGVSQGDVEFDEQISQADQQKFERIAAALVAKVPEDDEEGLEGDDNLLPFGSSPQHAKAAQKQLLQRASAEQRNQPGASSSGASDGRPAPLLMSALSDKRKKRLPMDSLPKVAVVGRPNVGKSALFNRMAGAKMAVVFDQPGITRDRMYTRTQWGGTEFVVVDTGGLMSDASQLPADIREKVNALRSVNARGLPTAIEKQAALGVEEADSVVLLVDGKAGLQAGDREILDWLRTNHPRKKVHLAVNKCDNVSKADLMASEFWELGLEPIPISAITGSGTGEMLDALVQALPPPKGGELEEAEPPLSIAIVGRPNVGKSSLLNAICGEERVIVCDISGTTRDAVDTEVTLASGAKLKLVDTAGIRKRTKVADSADSSEALSAERALSAMRRADVVVAIVDASEGITQHDFRLTEMAANEGRAVVVVVNKWDRVDTRLWTEERYIEDVRGQLRHVGWASVVCTTAHKGRAVDQVVEAIVAAGQQHRRRVSTATLNLVIREATAWKAPPTQRRSLKKGRIYYATQAAMRPPTFVFFVNSPSLISDDYRRYMERALRDNIGLSGTPLRLLWRGKPERTPPPSKPKP